MLTGNVTQPSPWNLHSFRDWSNPSGRFDNKDDKLNILILVVALQILLIARFAFQCMLVFNRNTQGRSVVRNLVGKGLLTGYCRLEGKNL